MKSNSLVSIVVVTYNSSDFVLETLESAYNQTYDNIELIISDDASTDNTIEVVKQWENENKDRFVDFKIISTPFNTGVAANLNRGIKECKGEWVKTIAGDDILLPDCIKHCISFTNDHSGCNALFSRMKFFKVNNGKKEYVTYKTLLDDEIYAKEFISSNAKEQFRLNLKDGGVVQAPTAFFRLTLLQRNPFPEKYKYCEDYPMWLQLTHNGYKLDFMPIETVAYRFGNSLSYRKFDYFSKNYMHTLSLFFWNEGYNFFKEENMLESYNLYRKKMLVYELTEVFTRNKKNIINTILVHLFNTIVYKFGRYRF